MSTIRVPSRTSSHTSTSSNNNNSSTLRAHTISPQPRKAKVVSLSNPTSSSSLPPTARTSTLSQQQPQPPRPTIKVRTSGPVPTIRNNPAAARSDTSGHVVRVSNGTGAGAGAGSRRIGSGSSVGSNVSVNNSNNNHHSIRVMRREGSITSSDDGTVSEDSIEDHIQLFSGAGGLHVNSLPFGGGASSSANGRNGGSLGASSGPRMAASMTGTGTIGRNRTPTSFTSFNSPSSTLSSAVTGTTGTTGTTGVTTAKPMRIAAGASIRIDTSSSASISGTSSVQSLNVTGLGSGSGSGIAGGGGGGSAVGLLSTSVSSSTSSSSLSWASNPSITSPTSVPGSAATSNHHQQPPSPVSGTFPGSGPGPQQPTATTVRAVAKPTNSSAAAATAAVAKQAEENRRTEEAARTRRKIADLEISNASLLQVNQTLEATIRKQAAEMQELKLRMQSAQYGGDLGLLASDVTMLSQDNALDPTQIHAATNPEAAVIIHELTEAERQADLTFKRLCITIEQMIFEAKQAMDQSTKKAGVKVLSSFDMYEKELEDGAEDDDPDTANQSMVMNEDDSFSQDLLDS